MFCEFLNVVNQTFFSGSYETVSYHNSILIFFYHWCGFFFSTMPELHINGRFPFHDSSHENDAFRPNYDTSSSLMVTGRTYVSTTAISTTTNTLGSENLFCGFVFFTICFSFALAIMIAIGIWLIRKRQKIKAKAIQKSNVSIQMEPLSSPNSVQNCHWTIKKHVHKYYHTVLQYHLRRHLTRRIYDVLSMHIHVFFSSFLCYIFWKANTAIESH